MYLKALEMVGFKSFAERTRMEFEPGMMGVVGPNGCGKSNVADAIKWVLGEQSPKALRGGQMTDVIFNGTDTAKALGMAEVSLTLADCESVLGTEYNEVTVTRRVFRTGEGHYYLNKTPCRLKDIQRLFMDTGLGTNSYCVMEQGRIDQILSSRPDDRREVFEEASGISKYKADKKEALRKLEHTDANLLRLGDILKEVKRQIISLQRQVGKAKRYKALQERLRENDLWLARGRLLALAAETASLEEGRKAAAAKEEELRGAVEAAEGRANELRQGMAALEEGIAAALEGAGEASGALERARELIRVNGERAAELEALSQRDSRESESAKATLEAHRNELDELKKQLIAATEDHAKARAEVEERQKALFGHDARTQEVRRRLQALRNEAMELDGRLARLQNELNGIEARERSDLMRRERASAEKAEAERAAETCAARLAEATARRDAKKGEAEEVRKRVEELRAAQGQRGVRLGELQRELSAKGSELSAREAQVALLERSRAEAQGFSAGAKKLLEGKGVAGVEAGDVLGTLAEKIRADRGYKTALEGVLRAWLDAVLVADAGKAAELARKVLAAKGGSVRLLPTGGEGAGTAEDGPGEALLAHVRTPKELAGLAERLLGRVRVVESAAEIPAAIPAGTTVVSRDGVLARGDGSAEVWMPGEKESTPLSRAHQLAEWKEDVERLKGEASGLKGALEELRAAENREREVLREAQGRLDALRGELAGAEGEIRVVERDGKAARERVQTIGLELAELERKTGAGTKRRGEIAEGMEAARKRQGEVREASEKDTAELHGLEDERTRRLEELTESRVAMSGFRQKMDGLKARGTPLEARIAELEALIRERGAGIDSYRGRMEKLTAETAEARARLPGLEAELARRQEELNAARGERETRNAELARQDAALREGRGELDGVREKRNEVELRISRTQLHRQNLLERMEADYQLREDGVLAAAEPKNEGGEESAGAEALEALVADLRAKLQAMGPVNLVAIEEYQELEERYAFLNQQNEDLAKAKQELEDFIRKINDTTTELFSDTFKKVNENFQELFKQLFGGGQANLVLVDEANVLESGIDITARPPGKKLQSVSLLSGGERTLTAVALLFALFKVKPSAFCLTDELDAALDDSNISRYLGMLRGFLNMTQFIVITHNRQTIAEANALYGVTMEKRGISKIVSMRFRGDQTKDVGGR